MKIKAALPIDKFKKFESFLSASRWSNPEILAILSTSLGRRIGATAASKSKTPRAQVDDDCEAVAAMVKKAAVGALEGLMGLRDAAAGRSADEQPMGEQSPEG